MTEQAMPPAAADGFGVAVEGQPPVSDESVEPGVSIEMPPFPWTINLRDEIFGHLVKARDLASYLETGSNVVGTWADRGLPSHARLAGADKVEFYLNELTEAIEEINNRSYTLRRAFARFLAKQPSTMLPKSMEHQNY